MKFLKALAIVASTAIVAACGGGDTEDRLDLRDPVVRFINAVPASINMTLYSGNSAQADATSIAYKSATHYYDVGMGKATWSARSAADNAVVLASTELDPDRGNRYTLLALPAATATGASLTVIKDPYNKGITSDRARVRFVHAAATTAAVDAYIIPASQDLATATPTFGNLGFGAALPASGNDSAEIDGGDYRLVLTLAGTKTVVFNAPTVTLGNNADWMLLAIPGATGLPNDMHVLVVQGNGDQDGQTQELVSQ